MTFAHRFKLLGFTLAALSFANAFAQPEPAEQEASATPVEAVAAPVQARASDRIAFAPKDNLVVGPNETAKDVVVFFGGAEIDGRVSRDVVTLFGSAVVRGPTGGDVIGVFGTVYVNSETRGDVISVLGGVELGPRAHVHGEVVSLGAPLVRHPQARVGRGVQEFGGSFGLKNVFGEGAWFRHALFLGRPLTLHPDVTWAWVVAALFLAGYVVIALLFNGAVVRCAETFEQRPARTLGATMLLMIALPLVFVLLIVTVVGPLVFLLALLAFTLFGKAAFLAWLGRRVTLPLGVNHSAPAVVIGGALLAVGYLVPVIGFMLLLLTSALGVGMAFCTLLAGINREKAAPTSTGSAPSRATAAAPTVATFTVPPVTETERFTSAPPPIDPSSPPRATQTSGPTPGVGVSATLGGLPRAGFWIRLAAAFIDVVIVGFVTGVLSAGSLFVPALAVYSVILWATKGTTIGGVVCGLKIVRLDEQPLDWPIATVRALGGFLSFTAAGLGFLWVIFDDDRQSWHDKIAGTTIVHAPKGASLI